MRDMNFLGKDEKRLSVFEDEHAITNNRLIVDDCDSLHCITWGVIDLQSIRDDKMDNVIGLRDSTHRNALPHFRILQS